VRSPITVLNVKGGRMPHVSEAQLRAFDISHNIKTGRKHGGVGLFENDGKSPIDLPKHRHLSTSGRCEFTARHAQLVCGGRYIYRRCIVRNRAMRAKLEWRKEN